MMWSRVQIPVVERIPGTIWTPGFQCDLSGQPVLLRRRPPLHSTAEATKVEQDWSPPLQCGQPPSEELVPIPTFLGVRITDNPIVVNACIAIPFTTTQEGDSSMRPLHDCLYEADVSACKVALCTTSKTASVALIRARPPCCGTERRQNRAPPFCGKRCARAGCPFPAHGDCELSASYCCCQKCEGATDWESLHLGVWKQIQKSLGVLRQRLLDMADVSEVTVSDLDDSHVRASLGGCAGALQDAHTRLDARNMNARP